MSKPLPVVIGSSTSPFVRKIRVALAAKAIEYQFELASSWAPTSTIGTLNPLNKVPVLKWSDDLILFDSRVIIQALELLQPQPALLPTDIHERIKALQIEALADGIADAAALYTQEGWRQPENRSAFWLQRQRSKIEAGLNALEKVIGDWSAALSPNTKPLTLVPIAVGSTLGFVSFWIPDLVWQTKCPQLAAFEAILNDYTSWKLTAPFLPATASFPKL